MSSPPRERLVLAAFEGTCVELRCNPHNVTELTAVITQHRPEDEADGDHHHHHGPVSAIDVAITGAQMKRFVPGKRYAVWVLEAIPEDDTNYIRPIVPPEIDS